MGLSDEQYKRIGRYLDGEPVELGAEELAAAREIRRDERGLAALLHVAGSPKAMARAERRMRAALARPRRWSLRVGLTVAAAAAVTVVVVHATLYLLRSGAAPQPAGPRPAGTETSQVVSAAFQLPWERDGDLAGHDQQVELLTGQVEAMAAEIMASLGPIDLQIEATQDAVDEFWLQESWPASAEG